MKKSKNSIERVKKKIKKRFEKKDLKKENKKKIWQIKNNKYNTFIWNLNGNLKEEHNKNKFHNIRLYRATKHV